VPGFWSLQRLSVEKGVFLACGLRAAKFRSWESAV
jgi:hypothetical protein